jgi:hypothetical protein
VEEIKKFCQSVDKEYNHTIFSREGRDETARSNEHFNAQPLLLAHEVTPTARIDKRIRSDLHRRHHPVCMSVKQKEMSWLPPASPLFLFYLMESALQRLNSPGFRLIVL